jgi:tetratricopeptide (TPR) repeat protein
LRQQLVTLDPKNPEYERKLGNSFMNVGAVYGSRRDFGEALKRTQQAIDIQQRLATAHPQDALYRRDLAKGLYNRALLENRAGRPADALRSCRQAMTLFQQLYDEQPRVIDFQGLAALTMRVVDEQAQQSGRIDDALAAFQQARQLTERLVQRNPLVSDYRAELAAILQHIADRTSDPEQALPYAVQAKDLLVQLVSDNPQAVQYRAQLADQWLGIGKLNLRLARTSEALAAFRQSLQASQALAAQDGNSETAQDAQARALDNIATAERAMPDHLTDARATYAQALAIYQSMAKKRPESPQVQEGLGRTFLNLGEVDDHLKQPDKALDEYRSAMEHQRKAVELAPQAVGFRDRLLGQCSELAGIHRQFGRTSDALAIGLEQKQLAKGNAQQLFDAARSLALTAAALGAPGTKLPDAKQAQREQAATAAIDALSEAIAAGLKDVPQRLANHDLRALDDIPKFRELLEKAGK